VPQADTACTVAAKLPKGFDDPSYRSSFIAGYISTAKVAPEKAGLVFDAIAAYCAAGALSDRATRRRRTAGVIA
jgi:hypothetical protein